MHTHARHLDKVISSRVPTRIASPRHVAPGTWSIGIYAGRSPLQLAPLPRIINPVLTAWHVTDVPAQFVADPFMLQSGSMWYMFFQVMNAVSRKGEIGLATSRNGATWQYEQIVLNESFSVSFPCVFRWNDDFYMAPESTQAGAVRLYRATSFPDKWECVKDLVEGTHADPSLFYFQRRWWMFACPSQQQHDVLSLYYADSPTGKWTQHPLSPIVSGNNRIARPAGRVLPWNGGLIRFTQDCYPTYGKQVRAFHISELTPTTYKEEEVAESPILAASGSGWNAFGMHHLDIHYSGNSRWLACVDAIA
jgi:hypothetical protein